MLNNYKEFILLESLLLESKLEFSEGLEKLLLAMPANRIKDILLNLKKSGTDIDITQNYLDISNTNKEEITFIQDRRAKDILGSDEIKYKTCSTSKFCTFNKNDDGEYKNSSMFKALRFQVGENGKSDHPTPPLGTIGVVVRSSISKVNGKTYCLYKWQDPNTNKENTIVANKEALSVFDDRYERIWGQTRNPIRVGRIIRAILTASKEKFGDQEIEQFVNLFKSTWDIINDAFLKFDVVSGEDIVYWYNYNNYESRASTLGSSCMSNVPDSFFDIYVNNPNVCQLVILYGESDSIKDGKFKGTKIRGRALLWKTDEKDMVMDRIYTNKDSDISLFKQYAEKHGWWSKKDQNSYSNFLAERGSETKRPVYTITLDQSVFDNYPYLDTFSYLNKTSKQISNSESNVRAAWEMRGTDGDLVDLDPDDEYIDYDGDDVEDDD